MMSVRRKNIFPSFSLKIVEQSIPIQNIYYLLCYAWNTLEERDIVDVESIQSTQLVDLFARVLTGGIHHLIRRGFDRGYLSFAEEMGRLRGKIDLASSLKKNLLARGRAVCEFDELDHNVLHNRILKTTIARLVLVEDLDVKLRLGLREILQWLRNIESLRLTSQTFRRVQLNRNNNYYIFLLNICELVYHNLLVNEQTGHSRFRDFLRDEASMNKLFERFARNFYRLEQSTFKPSPLRISWHAESVDEESERYLPEMRTDVCLTSEDRKIILECKYYKEALQINWNKSTIRSAHLYQLYAYLRNKEVEPGWETCEGILLYPLVDVPLNLNYSMGTHKVKVRTIDLNHNWQTIKANMLALIEA
jgi:5-methylcytosine-specific restriction enzyme subunit McrC